MTNPFSKDYVSKITIDHRDRTYKRPVLNQPPVNARAVIVSTDDKLPRCETYRRISKTKI